MSRIHICHIFEKYKDSDKYYCIECEMEESQALIIQDVQEFYDT